MKKIFLSILSLALLGGCSNNTKTGSNNILGGVNGTVPLITGNNVMRVEVGIGGNGLCDAVNSYENEPCTSVTICTPGTGANCQTINNVLVDTGSYGLRVFSSALNTTLLNSLTPVSTTAPAGNAAECAQFGTGSTWGPVEKANVILGQEAAVTVPIQIVNSGYATIPAACGTPDSSPSVAGYNAILGVGLLVQDCGATCVASANTETYYSCSGSTCTQATISLANQVSNPVAALGTDNTGVMMLMPTVASNGATFNYGYLVLGVGTETNNKPSNTQTYTADNNFNDSNYLNINVTYNGSVVGGFIDSGSNGLFIPSVASTPTCPSPDDSWFCPSGVYNGSATNTGINGNSGSVPFIIASAAILFNTPNYLFDDLGGPFSEGFDWGLPFFYGRYVYVGIAGKNVPGIGTGPYWAY
jgi:hypothetical protein